MSTCWRISILEHLAVPWHPKDEAGKNIHRPPMDMQVSSLAKMVSTELATIRDAVDKQDYGNVRESRDAIITLTIKLDAIDYNANQFLKALLTCAA